MATTQVVKFKHHKTTFEVLCKAGTIQSYRDGHSSLDKVLVADFVFKGPHNKGERAKESELIGAFGTTDMMECIKKIMKDGEFQLTSAERKEKVEKKRLEIINYIHKYYTDPRTKTPHPVTRIENALDELRPRIDTDTPAEDQAQGIIHKLVEFIPLKKSEVRGVITIPHASLGAGHPIVHKYCNIEKEDYNSEGCVMRISLVPGDFDRLIAEMSKVTKGGYDFEIEDGTAGAASSLDDEAGKGKAKKGKGGHGKTGKGGKKKGKR